MGRGSSKIGDGATKSKETKAISTGGKVATSTSEKSIYDISRTSAFPSTASVVKRVAPLKELDDGLKASPIGTTIAFEVGTGFKGEREKWVYEKANSKSWKSTVIDMTTGTARANGSYGGIKLLQSVADKKYNALDTGLTQADVELLKKNRRK